MFIKKIIFMFKLLVKQLPTLFLLRKVFFFSKNQENLCIKLMTTDATFISLLCLTNQALQKYTSLSF